MHNQPRQILTQLIKQHGPAICNEPLRLKAMLRDLCDPQHKREINILGFALDERIPHDLFNTGGIQSKFQLPRLSQRLQDAYAMSEEAAKWAVESWALALGVLSRTELNSVAWQTSSSQATSSPQPSTTTSQTSAGSTAAPPVQTLIVDQQGGGDYTDIQQAIENALPGARIMVRPGIYENHFITIEKPLHIVGDGLKDDILIKIDKNKHASNALLIHSNRVFIQNICFAITQEISQLKEEIYYKKRFRSEYIENKNERLFAIIINEKSSLSMKSCNVYGGSNAIRNLGGTVVLEQCNIFSCYRGVVSSGNLTIRNCNISNMIEDGIYIIAGQKVLIEHSDVIKNGGNGFYIWGGNGIIQKCNINENSNFGIEIVSGKPSIQNCEFTGNTNGALNVFFLRLWKWSFLSNLNLYAIYENIIFLLNFLFYILIIVLLFNLFFN